jgi:hypothetical protein
MQNTKDSFYAALRDRMAAQFPTQTMTIGDEVRPAILVTENEIQSAAPEPSGVFYLRYGVAGAADGSAGAKPLLKMAVEVAYSSSGSDELSFQDRGRELAKLDDILLAIATPPRSALRDVSQSPVLDLGAQIFWTRPELGEVKESKGELHRVASLNVFWFAEGEC